MLVIDDFYENGEKTFDQVKKIVDGYIVVDGSTFDYNLIENIFRYSFFKIRPML